MFKTWEKIFSPFLVILEYLVDSLNKQGFMLQESVHSETAASCNKDISVATHRSSLCCNLL